MNWCEGMCQTPTTYQASTTYQTPTANLAPSPGTNCSQGSNHFQYPAVKTVWGIAYLQSVPGLGVHGLRKTYNYGLNQNAFPAFFL